MDPVRFPRFGLIPEPSPLQPLPRLSAALGERVEVWAKREDLLPLAFGGNKLRNLEFLVGAALAEGADSLVTVGRRWSNHARLTAAAGGVAGLAVHLVLTGPGETASRSPNVRLCERLGATVHLTTTDDRDERTALAQEVTQELRRAGRRPYLIGVGGSGPLGALGQVLAGRELVAQAAAAGLAPDAVVVPSATGGTQAGLLTGLRSAGSAAAVVGVAVAHPAAELRAVVAGLLGELAGIGELEVDRGEIEIDPSQLGGGYGVPSAGGEEAMALLARSEGILVDPIYTAKALAGLIAWIRAGRLDGRRVVFWHAGGLPGLFESLEPPG